MRAWKFVGYPLVGACVVSAATWLAPLNPPSAPATNGMALLDPLFVASQACGGAGNRGRFRPPAVVAEWFAAKRAEAALPPQPLFDTLGDLTFPISTAVAEAQRYFDQGLKFAYAFNHGAALVAFRRARDLDPGCAMCAWGEALVLGPNINAPMPEAAIEPAVQAVEAAASMGGGATDKERALITALGERYRRGVLGDRADLDRAYAEAMGKVTALFPDDDDIAVLHAEAMMNTQPWDYWESGGTEPKGYTATIIDTLERVLARNPDHPAAIHLYIHTVEASTTPERAEAHADRLGGLMPGAGHLVHMPSHIYFRVGRFKDSIAANRDAVAADEAFFAKTAAASLYAGGDYPHNIHFLLTSAQMAGDAALAITAAEKLARVIDDEVARHLPWVQAIKAAPYFAHAQFSGAETVLALPEPAADFAYVRAMRHYARAVALAVEGDVAGARAEQAALAAIGRATDFRDLERGGLPALDLLELASHVIDGRIAQVSGQPQPAVEAFRAAVAVQDRLPYIEPPYWYYPVRQSLGAALLAAGEVGAAERELRTALVAAPNNGWALFALERVLAARGENEAAAAARGAFDKAWSGDPDAEVLSLTRL